MEDVGGHWVDKKSTSPSRIDEVPSPLMNQIVGWKPEPIKSKVRSKLAETQAPDQTIMPIAGHLSGKMLEDYSHFRMAAKRTA
jgi:hypothetical protein